MSEKEIDAKIGEAWKAHFKGDHDAAIGQFKKLVEEFPDHVDVLWGLGLSYRKIGQHEQALENFKHADELVTADLDKNPEEYGRLFMLNRMIKQQIELIAEFMD